MRPPRRGSRRSGCPRRARAGRPWRRRAEPRRGSTATRSGALDEEVQADRDDAEQQQRRVGAQEAGLRGAPPRRAGADDAARPADERVVDEDPLERLLAPAPEPQRGPDDEQVDELVEVPLVDEEA